MGNDKYESSIQESGRSGNPNALWIKVRRRRIYQITRFPIRILRELSEKFLLEQSSSYVPAANLSLTSEEINDSKRFELVTYLSKTFEKSYLAAMDCQLSKQARSFYFGQFKEMCCTFDVKFTETVLHKCRSDKAKTTTEDDMDDDYQYPPGIGGSRVNYVEVAPYSQPQQEKKIREAEKKRAQLIKEQEEKRIDDNYKMQLEKKKSSTRKDSLANIEFLPDKDRRNNAVHPRLDAVVVDYRYDNQIMPPWNKRALDKRLATWEPFWEVKYDVVSNSNYTGIQLAAVENFYLANGSVSNIKDYKDKEFKSCMQYSFKTPQSSHLTKQPKWGKDRNNNTYQTGDLALILRMLPCNPPKPDYKADTHTWPKGTFAQLNSHVIRGIGQRKQQIHDESLWKGNCVVLDLSPYCHNDPNKENILQIASLEYDANNPYGIQLAICQYKDPKSLLDGMISTISQIPYDQAITNARKYFQDHTISIDDSSDEDDNQNSSFDSNQLTFSLNCPISMIPIKTPVRGKDCLHLQCYDLSSFLHSNSFPSGGRWRCIGCNNLLCIQDLVQCGLFTKMIGERSKYLSDSGKDRSRAVLRGDGKWWLDEEKKEFNSNVIRGGKRKRNGSYGSMIETLI